MLKAAVEKERLLTNPCNRVRPPKVPTRSQHQAAFVVGEQAGECSPEAEESFTIKCTGFSVVYGRVIRPDTTHIETLQVAASVWPVAPDVDRPRRSALVQLIHSFGRHTLSRSRKLAIGVAAEPFIEGGHRCVPGASAREDTAVGHLAAGVDT